ncbi:MAG TPA: radical SAM protein [Planctomycetota bacterium]|nr:radical SAM protein [Planctomycetota bacterium]
MKVLLLRPPNDRVSYFSRFNLSEPLTEIYLGAHLAPRHEVRVVDLRVRPDLEAELGGFRPDAAVVAAHPLNLQGLDALLARLRRLAPGLRVLLVGAAEYGAEHVLERPSEYFRPLADALLPGYYLAPVRRVASAALAAWEEGRDLAAVPGLWVRSGERWEPTEPVPHAIGEIGVPDRTLLRRARGRYSLGGIARTAYVMYTHGCRFSCRYCSMSKLGSAIVTRPVADVVAELAELSEPNVFLADFEPLQAPQAMLALADAIEAAGIEKRWYLLTRADSALERPDVLARWQEIGLRWVFLGLDGHSAARLREIGKGSTPETSAAAVAAVRGLGLGLAVGITVSPEATREDFAEIRAAVRRLRPPLVDFTVETPLVGTRWFDQVEERLTTRDWSLYDMHHAVLPTRLPRDEFYREMTRLHVLAGWYSIPNMLRHYPLRDVARNVLRGNGAVWRSWRAARDHAAA